MSYILTGEELVDAFQSAPDGIAGIRAVEAAVVNALRVAMFPASGTTDSGGEK